MQEISKRKTKIVSTLGPATESPEVIQEMIQAGVNVFRLNMSHAPHDWVRRIVAHVRGAARACNAHVGIMMDTQGPAIRTGDLSVPLDLQPGQRFTLTVRGEQSEEECSVNVNYENFVNDISVGDIVLIDNGAIQMKVLEKTGHRVKCEVMTEGKLGSRRHINLPGVKVSLPALTAKDINDVELGLELKVDYIALSFVREARDLLQLKEHFKGSEHLPIVIAKIEDHQAVTNLDSIVREADGVMAARGDLGIEIPYEELPIVQRRIVKTCLRHGKPVIVATHMLESMINSPMPTRAEVTDVANAVFEQTDAIMLSGETTVGKYPVKCVEVFERIAKRTERSGGAGYFEKAELSSPRQKLAKSAVLLANELHAEAIVVVTRKGHLARYTSWMRPQYSPIIAVCESDEVARSLSLRWGVTPIVSRFSDSRPEETIRGAFEMLVKDGKLHSGNTVVVIGSVSAGDEIVDAVQMRVVE